MVYYLVEILLIIITFFLPGMLLPGMTNQNDLLNSPMHMGLYIGLSFLQLLFMFFLVKRDIIVPKENFGIVPFRLKHIGLGFLYSAGLFVVFFFMSALIALLPPAIKELFEGGFRWEPENPLMIPLYFLFSLVTGYREEFVFRSYVVARCGQLNIDPRISVGLGVILFGVLHLYEGIAGLVFALLSGVYLGLLYVKYKNLHIVAFCHAGFNFIALVLAFMQNRLH